MFVDANMFGLSNYSQKILCLVCTVCREKSVSLKKSWEFYKLAIRLVSCMVSLVLILRISSRLAF